MDIAKLITGVNSGDEKSLARAISLVENDTDGAREILEQLAPNDVPVIGVTGPPGAGKSTLINALVKHLADDGKKVGVLCIDPTSPFNYGSLLADRLRMGEHFNKKGVFIRSLATRGSLGGLSAKTLEITDVMRSSGFDVVIVETVGVGQSEVEIAGLADTTILVLVPEAGDEIQALKSGVMEIGDLFVVNKSDREGADRFVKNIEATIHQRPASDWTPKVVKAVATKGTGVTEILREAQAHYASISNEKRPYLLAEKAFQLIQHRKMAYLDKTELQAQISAELLREDFNFYAFVNTLIHK
ncbi:MAG: methylmalonyl Co-A mutase-associated GTPase MeaB [Flavobacteriales bacterium]|nr:methylmalonyl Co-A mutase-associated GTPase MeaB [Flavobacteriales bacterium]